MPRKTTKIKPNQREKIKEGLTDFITGHLSEIIEEAEDPQTIVKHAGQYNLKELMTNGSLMFAKMFLDAHTYTLDLRSRHLAMLDNVIKYDKSIDSRNSLHYPTHDFAFNRSWTFIDELVASLMAKTGLQHDVVADLLVKVLADAVTIESKKK